MAGRRCGAGMAVVATASALVVHSDCGRSDRSRSGAGSDTGFPFLEWPTEPSEGSRSGHQLSAYFVQYEALPARDHDVEFVPQAVSLGEAASSTAVQVRVQDRVQAREPPLRPAPPALQQRACLRVKAEARVEAAGGPRCSDSDRGLGRHLLTSLGRLRTAQPASL
jgi:hypothetical protein